eukprot:TRINITY_DN38311_c0_g1_i1.p1 TRINITY_DN38311_c0_g1~~TRINITY_DN38311_c0_g1_i1.p1  ORF type:complete len:120 (+),score=0.26 TRINITY_DN38311_c0_g1_i1:2-361(+)
MMKKRGMVMEGGRLRRTESSSSLPTDTPIDEWLAGNTTLTPTTATTRYECAVCVAPLNAPENSFVRTLPCLHSFHQHCIDNWITTRPSCPVCRSDINTLNKQATQLTRKGSKCSVKPLP